MEKNRIGLSQLPNETEISIEESNEVITAAELRKELLTDGDLRRANANWYTIKRMIWKPDARTMITDYIDQQCDEMYEDWDEHALGCIKKEHIQKLQAVLDDAFTSEEITDYWIYEKEIMIDTSVLINLSSNTKKYVVKKRME